MSIEDPRPDDRKVYEDTILVSRGSYIRTRLTIVALVLLVVMCFSAIVWGYFSIRHLTLGNRQIGKQSNAQLVQIVAERDARIKEVQDQNQRYQAQLQGSTTYLIQLANELSAHGLPLPPVPTFPSTTTTVPPKTGG